MSNAQPGTRPVYSRRSRPTIVISSRARYVSTNVSTAICQLTGKSDDSGTVPAAAPIRRRCERLNGVSPPRFCCSCSRWRRSQTAITAPSATARQAGCHATPLLVTASQAMPAVMPPTVTVMITSNNQRSRESSLVIQVSPAEQVAKWVRDNCSQPHPTPAPTPPPITSQAGVRKPQVPAHTLRLWQSRHLRPRRARCPRESLDRLFL